MATSTSTVASQLWSARRCNHEESKARRATPRSSHHRAELPEALSHPGWLDIDPNEEVCVGEFRVERVSQLVNEVLAHPVPGSIGIVQPDCGRPSFCEWVTQIVKSLWCPIGVPTATVECDPTKRQPAPGAGFPSMAGEESNLRPTHYESAAWAGRVHSRDHRRGPLTSPYLPAARGARTSTGARRTRSPSPVHALGLRAAEDDTSALQTWSSAPRAKLRTRSASPSRPVSTITGSSGSIRDARPSAADAVEQVEAAAVLEDEIQDDQGRLAHLDRPQPLPRPARGSRRRRGCRPGRRVSPRRPPPPTRAAAVPRRGKGGRFAPGGAGHVQPALHRRREGRNPP
jgi:hypothetical protein